jgi:putative thioredoxin
MNEPATPHVFDVSTQDFDAGVLQKSHELPVLVDFWAAWCGPCRMLTPVLVRLAQTYDGKFLLAKVDTDAEHGLAARYGIRGLPTVKVFRNGEVVDEFVGVQSETTIRQLIERHLPRASEAPLQQAAAAHAAGKTMEAVEILRRALLSTPDDDQLKLKLVELHLQQSSVEDARKLLAELSAQAKAQPTARALLARTDFALIAAAAPSASELEQTIARDANNVQARAQLGALRVIAHDYEGALQQLLEIVRRDRNFGDDSGRKQMLAVFDILGGKGALVTRYRNLLSTALN